jgi:LacI family transcriptional regulator
MIAEDLNVSTSTVSRVINKHPDVSQETRTKVLKKIEELGYVRNATATLMRNNVSTTIGVIFEAEYDPFFSEILQGIEKGISKYNYRMILINTKLRSEEAKSAVNMLLEHRVGGIIIVPSNPNISYAEYLVKRQFPVVVIGRDYKDLSIDEVFTDDYHGGELAGEYLVSRGATRLLMINSRDSGSASSERERGFRTVADNQRVHYEVINDLVTDYDNTFKIVRSIYSETVPFDGIFCFNDTRAFAAINAMRSINESLLKKVSVIGYDDILFSSIFSPKLTSIRIDKDKEGFEAVKLLNQRVRGTRKSVKREILNVSLVIRET